MMKTFLPVPIITEYLEVNVGKFRSVRHFKSRKETPRPLSDLLNISKDRKCAKSSPTFWLQTHDGIKWVKPRLTGLFKTEFKDFYYGDAKDSNNKRHLLLFHFCDRCSLKVYFYQGYYTKDISVITRLIRS